ncbi:putative disease resistance protein RGA3 [Triticum dicoccoides]|uniref:putative disease resistance protein RGA3 n=1 Tax=Triticum dicoccoides TaxID=85692 RepID=UPI00188DE3F7|nr:putative disease resistance protein RGA3 [Triticum dicoccoides]
MVPLLIPLLGSVAAKAGDAMVRELLRAWGLDKARRKLERHLAAVQCILLDAEDKSRTYPAIRQWIKDLKTAAYEADDVLDAFRYEVLRRRAAQIRSHSTARKVLSYFSVNSPIVFRLSMSGKMKDALKIIDELVAEMNTFHFLQNTEAPTIIHPRTNSHVDNSEIVGKEDEKELVVNILLEHSNINNDNDDNTIMVLPKVGMGGGDCDVWKNDILTTRIVPALQLSYDHLKSEEKICFSFCAIFPKGSIMDKDMLIHLWMANDFVPSETRGQQIFDLLVWKCFIQDGHIHNNLLSGFRDEYNEFIYRPTTYKMHDLMHDLADSVSGNDCSILQESSCHQIPQEKFLLPGPAQY